ncbi:C6 zinc finger protein [Rhexocercosporidium sp. MPI-PUGE-AT-0058]|nr:C6 zinc finger protein [Rhexocercosporidium sp. MPI-PUGE-AT-0058]
MVFTGRMSRGCESCRKLHTKCDEKRPACSRCLRIGKKCTGYRDESDLMFRHTDPKLREKGRSAMKKGGNMHHSQTDLRTSHDRSRKAIATQGISKVLLPSKEDQKLCFFYHTTMENLVDSDPTQYLHSQLPTLLSRSRPGSTLHLAAQALSYATWGRYRLGYQGVALSASKRYSQALSALATAIADPIEAKSDETLYAVLLLCGYETITFNPEALPAWGTHVDGAMALVQKRGNQNFSTPLSRMMFIFIRRNALQSHVQTSTPVDSIFHDCGEVLSSYENVEDQLLSKTMRIPQLQSLANEILSQSSIGADCSTASELLQSAESLDRELAKWAFQTPAQWSYKTIIRMKDQQNIWTENSTFVPDQIHRYPDIYVARTWNLYRVSRLIIQSIIFRVSYFNNFMSDSYQDRIDSINRSMVDGISASIPFLLGYDCSELKHSTTIHGSLWPQSSPNKPRASNNTGRFSLVWPLYIATSVSSAPENQLRWLRDQLDWMAGIGEVHAQVLRDCKSQTLEGRPENFRFDCV